MTFKVRDRVIYLGIEHEVIGYGAADYYHLKSPFSTIFNVHAKQLSHACITAASSNGAATNQIYGSSNNNIVQHPVVPPLPTPPNAQMQSKFNIGDRILAAWSAERGKITNIIYDGINHIYEVQMDNFTGTERFFEADLILDKKNMELNKITNTAVCKCGSWTTYGKEAPKEAHSFWCDIVTGGKE